MITPTVGRIVWFHPGARDRARMNILGDQPMRADIVYVHNDRTVNLSVTDHRGMTEAIESVRLVQDGETPPERFCYCEWMPYQTAVAKGEIAPTQHAPGAAHISTKATELDNH